MRFDLPLDELRSYQAPDTEPRDFDAFWQQTLADSRRHDLAAEFTPLEDDAYHLVDVSDVTFAGWAGQPIRGWFLEPAGNRNPLPCVVSYVGYGGGRSLPLDHMAPAVAGFAHLVMDTRGQGSVWSPGTTPDEAGSGPQVPGFMTRGIEARETYYYRRVFTDAVRAVEAACSHPHVDAERIAVAGASQGGGISIATAGLIPERVRLLIADVPFLCHFRRGAELTDHTAYGELKTYLSCHRDRVETVFETLAYFDGVNFAPRVRAAAQFSVGLMDIACPPSTVFAVFNRVSTEKDIHVYEFNAHEGGGPVAQLQRLRFLRQHFGQ